MSEGKSQLEGWMNKPSHVVMKDDSHISVRVPKQTDCPDAPFCWQKITGDFQITVKVSGDFAKENDKAGIMIRLDDSHWIVTGMEYYNGQVNHTTTVMLEDMDWSIVPLPEGSEKTGVWFCFKRLGNAYECFFSMDARKWIQTRQGQFLDSCTLYAGITCACPKGNEFQVTFETYACTDRFV
jgi:uncharacterized protein